MSASESISLPPSHIVVMGVSGCGKSTLAQALASQLGWEMLEGDAFHPAHNVAKMAAGLPLADADRAPWLAQLNASLRQRSSPAVLSCSALKARYRAQLSHSISAVFVHVHGSYDTLLARMQLRTDHFMPASLLSSQFDALEMPTEPGIRCVSVSIEHSTAEQVRQVLAFLNRTTGLRPPS